MTIKVKHGGMGCNADKSLKQEQVLANKHFNLAGMSEWANLIGAEMSINSRPNVGTRVHVIWKMKENISEKRRCANQVDGAVMIF